MGATPVLVTSLARRAPSINHWEDRSSPGRLRQAVRRLAAAENVPLVDLFAAASSCTSVSASGAPGIQSVRRTAIDTTHLTRRAVWCSRGWSSTRFAGRAGACAAAPRRAGAGRRAPGAAGVDAIVAIDGTGHATVQEAINAARRTSARTAGSSSSKLAPIASSWPCSARSITSRSSGRSRQDPDHPFIKASDLDLDGRNRHLPHRPSSSTQTTSRSRTSPSERRRPGGSSWRCG